MIHPTTLRCADLIREVVGRPWRHQATGPDAYDCWGLAQHVQRELYARHLPSAASFVSDGRCLREIIDTIKASELQRHWAEVDLPRPGDLVLMARSAQFTHVGVWVDGGPGLIGCLHAIENSGVLLQGLAELKASWRKVSWRRCLETSLTAIKNVPDPLSSRPILVVVNDPLDPLHNADIRDLKAGISARDAVAALPDAERRWLCLNDMPLMRRNPATGEDEWLRPVGHADVLWALPPLPAGDEGTSQVIATVAAIAATVAAPYAAAALGGGAFGTASALTATGKLLSAGIAIGANMLIGSFIRTPSFGQVQLAKAEPTYTFADIGNQMRPGSVIPRIYGTMRRQPDLLAAPWVEYDANEQIIHILLCVGHGAYEVTEFGVGDTAVWTAEAGLTGAISGCEFQIVAPGKKISLFPVAVETNAEVDGIELAAPAQNLPEPTVGPFVAVPAGSTATHLVFDFVFPYGLFDISGNDTVDAGVTWHIQAQLIDDLGQPSGFMQTLDVITVQDNTTSRLSLTRRYNVEPGRYRVQVLRTSERTLQGQGRDTLYWAGLRAQLDGARRYHDVTVLALRVRADAASVGAIQQWYVKATAVLPHFNDAGEIVTGPTEAIEAGALDILRSPYGLARDDTDIDLIKLRELAQTWRDRGDVLCTAVEGETGCWDALAQVLQAGRTRPQFLGGMVTFVRDEPRLAAPRLITDADMVRGSFSVERLHPRHESPNAVNMRYRDRDGTMRSLVCVPDGISDPKPADVFSSVIVDAPQAWREGHYMAAANNYRRRYMSFVMLEGAQTLLPGTAVDIAHPRPDYGAPARILSVDWPYLDLARSAGLEPGEVGWLGISMPDGQMWGPVRCRGVMHKPSRIEIDSDDFDHLKRMSPDHVYPADPRDWIVSANQGAPSDAGPQTLVDRQSEPTRAVIGRPDHDRVRALVLETVPRDQGQFEVLAVEDVADVHTAELAQMPVDILPASLQNETSPVWRNVVITGRLSGQIGDGLVALTIAGPAVSGAVQYLAEMANTLNASVWSSAGSASTPTFSGPVISQDVYIRVAAVGPVLRGPWQYYHTRITSIFDGDTIAVPVQV